MKIESIFSRTRTWSEQSLIEVEKEYGNIVPLVCRAYPGDVVLLQGPTGIGKSTFSRNLAAHLAAGKAFPHCFNGNEPQRVLYLDFETPAPLFIKDGVMITNQFSQNERRLIANNLEVFSQKDIDNRIYIELTQPDHVAQLKEKIEQSGSRIIFMDTFGKAIGNAKENDATEMRSIAMSPLNSIAAQTKSIIFILHHVGKPFLEGGGKGPSKNNLMKARGSSVIASESSTVIHLEGNSPQEILTLSYEKDKTGEGRTLHQLRINKDSRSVRFLTVDSSSNSNKSMPDHKPLLKEDGFQALIDFVREGEESGVKRKDIIVFADSNQLYLSENRIDYWLNSTSSLSKIPGKRGYWKIK